MIGKELIEKKISDLLQREIKFIINGKVVRSGRLVIFNLKDFYASFILINNKGDKKIYEVPYPFSVNQTDDGVEFDYSLDTLSNGNKMLYYKIKLLNKVKKNKLYDNKMIIKYKI